MSDTTAKYTFRITGLVEFHTPHQPVTKWIGLRVPMWKTTKRDALDAVTFQGRITEWLMNEPVGKWHAGNGNAHGYAPLPQSFTTGSAFCILLQRITDVVLFANEFDVADMNDLDIVLEQVMAA